MTNNQERVQYLLNKAPVRLNPERTCDYTGGMCTRGSCQDHMCDAILMSVIIDDNVDKLHLHPKV